MGLSEGHFEISSTLWLFFTALQDISAGPRNPPAEWWAPPETLGCKPPTRPARASHVASGSKGQNRRSQNFSGPRYSTVKTSKISKSGHFSCWTNTKQPIWCWPNRQLCIPSASPFALEAQRYQALEPTPQSPPQRGPRVMISERCQIEPSLVMRKWYPWNPWIKWNLIKREANPVEGFGVHDWADSDIRKSEPWFQGLFNGQNVHKYP